MEYKKGEKNLPKRGNCLAFGSEISETKGKIMI
jgi:hypothetical protein